MENYAQQDASRLEKILLTSAEKGLGEAELERRRATDGKNHLLPNRSRPFARFLTAALRRTSLYLWVAVIVLAFVWESLPMALVIAACVLALATALFFVYRYRERGYAAKELAALPTVTVIRDGDTVCLSPEELVCGDLLLLKPGDILYADAHLITEEEICVFCERNGKRQTVKKRGGACFEPSGEPFNTLYRGDVIREGKARAFVTATSQNEIEPPREGESIPPSLSKMCRTTLYISYIVAFLLLSAGVLLLAMGVEANALVYAALFIAAGPFEWYALLLDAAFLLKSNQNLRNDNVSIASPAAAEILAGTSAYLLPTHAIFRTDRFCVRSFESGTGFRVTAANGADSPELRQISAALLAMYEQNSAELCEKHILSFCRDHAIGAEKLTLGTLSVSSEEDGCSMASFLSSESGHGFSLIGGDPEFLLARTMYTSEGGRVCLLDGKTRDEMLANVRKMKQEGYQLVAYTETQTRIVHGMSAANLNNLKLLGFFVLTARPDEQIGATLEILAAKKQKTVFIHDGEDPSWIAEEFSMLSDAPLLDGQASDFEEQIAHFVTQREQVFAIGVHLTALQQSRLAHALENADYRVAAYGSSFFDHRMICAASASFAPLPENRRNTAPVVTAAASAFTGEKIISQVGCIRSAKSILISLKAVAFYLTTSVAVRGVLLLALALLGVWQRSTVELLMALSLFGMATDLLAFLGLSYGSYDLSALEEKRIQRDHARSVSALFGAPVAAVATIALAVVAELRADVFRFSSSAIVASCFVFVLIVAFFGFNAVDRRGVPMLFPTLSLVALVIAYLSRLFAFYPETLCWALIPVALMLAVGQIAENILLRRWRLEELQAYELEK